MMNSFMDDSAHRLAGRIISFEWPERRDKRHSQADLMSEYLRRAAWSSCEHETPWPFFDFANAINPDVRAAPQLVEAVKDSVPPYLHFMVPHTCEWSLHFAALQEVDPESVQLANPFDPLLLMYERGNPFTLDASGFIEVDFIGVPKGSRGDHLKWK